MPALLTSLFCVPGGGEGPFFPPVSSCTHALGSVIFHLLQNLIESVPLSLPAAFHCFSHLVLYQLCDCLNLSFDPTSVHTAAGQYPTTLPFTADPPLKSCLHLFVHVLCPPASIRFRRWFFFGFLEVVEHSYLKHFLPSPWMLFLLTPWRFSLSLPFLLASYIQTWGLHLPDVPKMPQTLPLFEIESITSRTVL